MATGHVTKVCFTCHEEKPLEAFRARAGTAAGFSGSCRACLSRRRHERWVMQRRPRSAVDLRDPQVSYRDLAPHGWADYCVGTDGSVWSHRSGEWVRLKPSRSGYRYTVTLYRDKKGKPIFVHRIVAAAFLGERPAGMHICHNNGNGADNSLANLRYDTPEANEADKVRHGTSARGDRMPTAKLNADAIRVIRRRLAAGETLLAIATDYGVDFTLISAIKRRKVWAWVE